MGQLLYSGDIHAIEQAKVVAARTTRKSGNERRGAESELARFSASLSNRRAMDAAGVNINEITDNIATNLDAAAFGTFQSRISGAEELGASAALAAAAGVGGASTEVYNATVRLNHAMQEEQSDRAVNHDVLGASAARGRVLTEAIAGLDNNVYRADQDFSINVDHKKMGMFERVGSLALAAGATYFGGPQAGMAVLGMAEAQQLAANGNYAGANQAVMGAVQNGIGGIRAFRAGAGQGQLGSPVGGALWDSVRGSGRGGSSGIAEGGSPVSLAGSYGDRRVAMGYSSIRIN